MNRSVRLQRIDLSVQHRISLITKKISCFCPKKQLDQAQSLINQAKLLAQTIKNLELRTQLLSSILNTEAAIYHDSLLEKQTLSTIDEAILLQQGSIQNLAKTYLAKCKILNDYQRHEQALAVAKKTNKLLSGALKSPNRFERENARELYIVSFLAIGAQYEKVKKFGDAVDAYEKGVSACRLWVGERSKLIETLTNSLNALKKKGLGERVNNRTSDRASIRTNTETSSVTKQKNFRIKQSISKNPVQDKTRVRGSSVKTNRVQQLINAYHPKLKSIQLKSRQPFHLNSDEMKDIERIKILYKPLKDKKQIRQTTQPRSSHNQEDWCIFRNNEISI